MSQSVVHSRQPSRNSKQIHTLRKDSLRGEQDANDICSSPSNKYHNLIKRFNKKPESIQNSHLKYVQNGIKDINLRNINFQLKNSDSHHNLMQQYQPERMNAHKIIMDTSSQCLNIDQAKNAILPNQQKACVANSKQQNPHKVANKQGSVKPIRTIYLNLFEHPEDPDLRVKKSQKSESKPEQQVQHERSTEPKQLNKSTLNGGVQTQAQQINLGKLQNGINSSTTLSNSTRFSPRYSNNGLNLYTQGSQQSIQQFSKDQQDSLQLNTHFYGNPESSESDLNQNDSTITTPTKYQQFSHYTSQNDAQHNIKKNGLQNSKFQSKNSVNSSSISSNISNVKNNYQLTTTPIIMKKNMQPSQEQLYNQSTLKESSSYQMSCDSPSNYVGGGSNLNMSKVNLSHLLKNASVKNYFTPNCFSLLSSNVHSRKSSSNHISKNDLVKLNAGNTDQSIQQDIVLGDKYNNSQYQFKSSRGNSISISKPNYLQTNTISHKQQLSQHTIQNNTNRFQSNLNPLTKRVSERDTQKSPSSNNVLQSKKTSAHFQVEESSFAQYAQNKTSGVNQQNISSIKLIPHSIESGYKGNNSLSKNQQALIQSCNMNSQQALQSQSISNSEYIISQTLRDRSQTYTLDDNKQQRSTSRGNIKAVASKPSMQTNVPYLNKSQVRTLNQSSSQINLSTMNATSSSIVPSLNSAFNFQPSFFTPIDNDSLQGFIQKQTTRNNSQVKETNLQSSGYQFTKQRSQTQFDLQTITSFIQLEEEIENKDHQQQVDQSKKLKLFS